MRPILFYIGSTPIRSFGVMVLIGFLLALRYAMAAARRRMAKTGQKPGEPGVITPDHVFDMSMIGLFIGILGARLLYVLLDLDQFKNPLDVIKIWTGGITIVGAILTCIPFLWFYCRRHKLPFFAFADIAAPAFALGYAIGRIGCLLNGCCYGHACDLPWAMRFPDERFPNANPAILTPPSHPTQIYATLFNLAWFVLLDRWSRRSHRDGEIFLGYLALYCVYRFVDEQFRKGATADIFALGLTHAQAFILVVLPILLLLLWRLRRKPVSQPAVPRAVTPA